MTRSNLMFRKNRPIKMTHLFQNISQSFKDLYGLKTIQYHHFADFECLYIEFINKKNKSDGILCVDDELLKWANRIKEWNRINKLELLIN